MAVLATDDFNRANNTDLGTNWTVATDLVRFGIVSQQAHQSDLTGSDGGEYYNAVTPANDQYTQAKATLSMTDNDDGFNGIGVTVRHSTSAKTFYTVIAIDAKIKLFRSSGGFTLLGSSNGTWVDGDVLYIEAQGTTLKAKVAGVEKISLVDATIASGRAGVTYGTTGTGATQAYLDDWECGDFAAAGGRTTKNTRSHPLGYRSGVTWRVVR